jgi:hypothetical protein
MSQNDRTIRNFLLLHQAENISYILILLFTVIPILSAEIAVISITSSSREQCTSSSDVNLNAWTWLVVHAVAFACMYCFIPIWNVWRNVSFLLRHSRIRQRSWLSKKCTSTLNLFLFIWNIVGLVIVDQNKVAEGCSEHVSRMILATCVLGLLLEIAVVCVGVMCLPCIVILVVRLLRPVGARALRPEEVNIGLAEITYNRSMEQEEPDECVVCQVEYENEQKIMEIKVCHHRYHHECIVPWVSVNNSCPLCRAIVVLPKTIIPEDELDRMEPV